MHRSQRGSTGIEVMAAVAIVIMASLFSLRTLSAASKATIRVRATDRATAFGYQVMERSRAFGCGTEVYNESALPSRQTGCNGLGTSTFTQTDDVSNVFTATVYTSWANPDLAPTAGCTQFTGAGASRTPSTLVRTVVVAYMTGEVSTTRTIRSVESVPPDAIAYNSQVRGGLVISATPNAVVQMINDAGRTISRQADTRGCAWFPFLPPAPVSSPRITVGSCAARVVAVVPRVNTVVAC